MKALILSLVTTLSACTAQHSGGEVETSADNFVEEVHLSFELDILPIVQNRCNLCHNENSSLPNWQNYDLIFENKENVRFRVFEARNMPQGNATGMTNEERELLALWVDQGALP